MDWALLPLSTCNLELLLVAGNCLLYHRPELLTIKGPSSQHTPFLAPVAWLISGVLGKSEHEHTPRCQDTGTHLCKLALWLLSHATLRYVLFVILCIQRKVCWWTGRCCLYPLRDVLCDGFVRVRCGSMVMQATAYTSTVSGVVTTQHSLILGAGPYCVLTVQDQRSWY